MPGLEEKLTGRETPLGGKGGIYSSPEMGYEGEEGVLNVRKNGFQSGAVSSMMKKKGRGNSDRLRPVGSLVLYHL